MRESLVLMSMVLVSCSTSLSTVTVDATDASDKDTASGVVELLVQDLGTPPVDVLDLVGAADVELVVDVSLLQCDPGEGCFWTSAQRTASASRAGASSIWAMASALRSARKSAPRVGGASRSVAMVQM